MLKRLTRKLDKKVTEVVRSNGKNMNHSLMEHLMVCYCHELETNWEAKQQLKKGKRTIQKKAYTLVTQAILAAIKSLIIFFLN